MCNDYNKNRKKIQGRIRGLKTYVHVFTLQTQLFILGEKMRDVLFTYALLMY